MSPLPLESLEIQNFRALRHLRIQRLGRVNLIVGKNNVGKSSVLEALRLYSEPWTLSLLMGLLESRDEVDDKTKSKWTREKFRVSIAPFFSRIEDNHQRTRTLAPIVIGPITPSERQFRIEVEFFRNFIEFSIDIFTREDQPSPFGQNHLWPLKGEDDAMGDRSEFVPPQGISVKRTARLWDAIALTELEEDVVRGLRLISEDIDRLVLRSSGLKSPSRVPFVKLAKQSKPVPLRSLGDGVNRMFGLALAMVSCKGGLLLLDEIENGIHYSVLPNLWRFIFEMAKAMDVQVFATTHGYDCLRAFEVAARESDEEGVLIRLASKGGETIVAEYDERELGIAVEGGIEVR